MPLIIEGKTLYRIGEALDSASMSRATYFRWLKIGRLRDTQFKDRNGRRVFTEAELKQLTHEAQRLVENPQMELRLE
jgi:predicted site-specific integrase-resolvase